MPFSTAISALIPNYNGVPLFEKYLPDVLTALRSGDELIIVDDTSTDNSVKWLIERFDCQKQSAPMAETELWSGLFKTKAKQIAVSVLVNLKNQRFGASCNRGVLIAQHELIFLLNSDVAPHADSVAPLLAHFDPKSGGEQVFGVGCLEIETTNQNHMAGKQTLWFERGMFLHAKAKDFSAGETAWVTGGSGLFSKSKWLQIGGFDALYYPAYWEDIDLSFQARKRGWKVLFEPKSVVDHNHETTNQTVFGQKKIEQMSWRNAKKFVWKNGTIWQKIAFLIWQPYWWWKRHSLN
jgi:GT2 family glycosyltransferase